jgi:dienelactone hydrolase
MPTLTWPRSSSLVFVLALGCSVFVPVRAPGQFQMPGAGAVEKDTGSFSLDGKTKIDYWQFEPKTVKGVLPAVLVLHGIEGLDAFANGGDLPKELVSQYKLFCKMVAEKGYVVRFVRYMQCKPVSTDQVPALKEHIKASLVSADGKAPAHVEQLFKEWMGCVKKCMDDLKDPKNTNNANVDKDRVGVVGLSMGGFIAMALAVTDPKFDPQALVVVCGGMPPQLHDKVEKLPPVLMICGTKDDIVPFKHTQTVRKCLEDKGCSVFVLPFPCYHMFMDDTVDKGKVQLNLVLQAQTYAELFLNHNVQKAPKAPTPK